ncbi:hypothetical protein PAPYR_13258 [Paratrimastix pyriformis]|uniref:Uncharacterized protein n=1 Tax=Paratrimastix pyriformis TaxID=342808 RepID=A0ABQ8U0K9_9EUKA|nr:hypothetical protein PAPYR_13258 [Paratrimastix pyriformis]
MWGAQGWLELPVLGCAEAPAFAAPAGLPLWTDALAVGTANGLDTATDLLDFVWSPWMYATRYNLTTVDNDTLPYTVNGTAATSPVTRDKHGNAKLVRSGEFWEISCAFFRLSLNETGEAANATVEWFTELVTMLVIDPAEALATYPLPALPVYNESAPVDIPTEGPDLNQTMNGTATTNTTSGATNSTTNSTAASSTSPLMAPSVLWAWDPAPSPVPLGGAWLALIEEGDFGDGALYTFGRLQEQRPVYEQRRAALLACLEAATAGGTRATIAARIGAAGGWAPSADLPEVLGPALAGCMAATLGNSSALAQPLAPVPLAGSLAAITAAQRPAFWMRTNNNTQPTPYRLYRYLVAMANVLGRVSWRLSPGMLALSEGLTVTHVSPAALLVNHGGTTTGMANETLDSVNMTSPTEGGDLAHLHLVGLSQRPATGGIYYGQPYVVGVLRLEGDLALAEAESRGPRFVGLGRYLGAAPRRPGPADGGRRGGRGGPGRRLPVRAAPPAGAGRGGPGPERHRARAGALGGRDGPAGPRECANALLVAFNFSLAEQTTLRKLYLLARVTDAAHFTVQLASDPFVYDATPAFAGTSHLDNGTDEVGAWTAGMERLCVRWGPGQGWEDPESGLLAMEVSFVEYAHALSQPNSTWPPGATSAGLLALLPLLDQGGPGLGGFRRIAPWVSYPPEANLGCQQGLVWTHNRTVYGVMRMRNGAGVDRYAHTADPVRVDRVAPTTAGATVRSGMFSYDIQVQSVTDLFAIVWDPWPAPLSQITEYQYCIWEEHNLTTTATAANGAANGAAMTTERLLFLDWSRVSGTSSLVGTNVTSGWARPLLVEGYRYIPCLRAISNSSLVSGVLCAPGVHVGAFEAPLSPDSPETTFMFDSPPPPGETKKVVGGVRIPPGAVTDPVQLSVAPSQATTPPEHMPASQGAFSFGNYSFALPHREGYAFALPITISLSFEAFGTAPDGRPLIPVLLMFDPASQQYVDASTTCSPAYTHVDYDHKLLEVNICHLTTFALVMTTRNLTLAGLPERAAQAADIAISQADPVPDPAAPAARRSCASLVARTYRVVTFFGTPSGGVATQWVPVRDTVAPTFATALAPFRAAACPVDRTGALDLAALRAALLADLPALVDCQPAGLLGLALGELPAGLACGANLTARYTLTDGCGNGRVVERVVLLGPVPVGGAVGLIVGSVVGSVCGTGLLVLGALLALRWYRRRVAAPEGDATKAVEMVVRASPVPPAFEMELDEAALLASVGASPAPALPLPPTDDLAPDAAAAPLPPPSPPALGDIEIHLVETPPDPLMGAVLPPSPPAPLAGLLGAEDAASAPAGPSGALPADLGVVTTPPPDEAAAHLLVSPAASPEAPGADGQTAPQ